MHYSIHVENIKCSGCAGTITKKINAINGVEKSEVDIDAGIVYVKGVDGLRETLTSTLLKFGYPESGTIAGVAAAEKKARSFVSCAVGRMSRKS